MVEYTVKQCSSYPTLALTFVRFIRFFPWCEGKKRGETAASSRALEGAIHRQLPPPNALEIALTKCDGRCLAHQMTR